MARPLLVRKFDSQEVIQTTTSVFPPSSYFPYPMKRALHKCLQNKVIQISDFILCPIYAEGDFQIGVTGSVEYNEEITNGISRELGEEIGIVPCAEINLIEKYDWRRKNRVVDFYIFEAPIRDCIPVLEHQHDADLHKTTDSLVKVGCYIHGDRDLVTIFLSSERIFVYKNNDNIVGVAAIRVEDILRL